MFSVNHFIWLAVCVAILAVLIVLMVKYKPPQKLVFTVASICAGVSEVTKTLAKVEIVSTASGGYTPYIEMQQVPLHLCSIMVFIIFAVALLKEGRVRNVLLAFMYPTCALLPILALMIPTTLNSGGSNAFTSVMPYQYFLYHTMLIALGFYIATSGIIRFKVKHIFTSLAIMGAFAYIAIYANSILATVGYSSGSAVVEYIPNLFYVYGLPSTVGLFTITEKWQWLLYFCCIVLIAFAVFTIMYLPFILRNRKRSLPLGEGKRFVILSKRVKRATSKNLSGSKGELDCKERGQVIPLASPLVGGELSTKLTDEGEDK